MLLFEILIGGICCRNLDTVHGITYAVALCISESLQSTNEDKNSGFCKAIKQYPISCLIPEGVLPDVLLLTNLYQLLFYVLPLQKLDNKRIME